MYAGLGLVSQITGTQCTHSACRWNNGLAPGVKLGLFERDEDLTIIRAHAEFGNKFARIAELLPGRTANSIRVRWRSVTLQSLRVAEGLPAGDPVRSRVGGIPTCQVETCREVLTGLTIWHQTVKICEVRCTAPEQPGLFYSHGLVMTLHACSTCTS